LLRDVVARDGADRQFGAADLPSWILAAVTALSAILSVVAAPFGMTPR
jgi:hypothetical protein